MNNLVTEIWEVRGMVDDAIRFKDVCKLSDAYKRLSKDCDCSNLYLYSPITSTKQGITVYKNVQDIHKNFEDRQQNWNKITLHMSKIVQYFLDGIFEDVPYGETKSALEDIWVARGLYDNVVAKLNDSNDKEKLKVEIEKIYKQLSYCFYDYETNSSFEENAIIDIEVELDSLYVNLFGTLYDPFCDEEGDNIEFDI